MIRNPSVRPLITSQPLPEEPCQPSTSHSSAPRPLALEMLVEADGLSIQTSYNNYGLVSNSGGQKCYFSRHSGGITFIYDDTFRKLLRIAPPPRCCAGCYCCCVWNQRKTRLTVEMVQENAIIGFLRTPCCGGDTFIYDNENEQYQLAIVPPACICCDQCCSNNEFQLYEANALQPVGYIKTSWAEIGQEWFTADKHYKLKFPRHLDEKMKVLVLAAALVIACSKHPICCCD